VIGSQSQLKETYTQLIQKHKHATGEALEPLADPDKLSILDVNLESLAARQITTGTGNAASGAASFAYLETAIQSTKAGEFEGIVTGPIAKSAWKAAGYNYPGKQSC
jgi:4-hydroxythreonine-4-phosphate dehydrogenase